MLTNRAFIIGGGCCLTLLLSFWGFYGRLANPDLLNLDLSLEEAGSNKSSDVLDDIFNATLGVCRFILMRDHEADVP